MRLLRVNNEVDRTDSRAEHHTLSEAVNEKYKKALSDLGGLGYSHRSAYEQISIVANISHLFIAP